MPSALNAAIQRIVRNVPGAARRIGYGHDPGPGPKEWWARVAAIQDEIWEEIQADQEAALDTQKEDLQENWIVHRILRNLGASEFEALQVLLEINSPMDRPITIAEFLPHKIEAKALLELLERYGVHPLSAARQFCNKKRALAFLGHVGLERHFGSWIGPGGRLLIRGDDTVRALPPNLVLRGRDLIADCRTLEDLGEGMISLIGPLSVERCAKLTQLPNGFETQPMCPIPKNGVPMHEDHSPKMQVFIRECPNFVRLGERTRIRGVLLIAGCPKFLADSHAGVDRIERHVTASCGVREKP